MNSGIITLEKSAGLRNKKEPRVFKESEFQDKIIDQLNNNNLH